VLGNGPAHNNHCRGVRHKDGLHCADVHGARLPRGVLVQLLLTRGYARELELDIREAILEARNVMSLRMRSPPSFPGSAAVVHMQSQLRCKASQAQGCGHVAAPGRTHDSSF
jgi:hypothetical protein